MTVPEDAFAPTREPLYRAADELVAVARANASPSPRDARRAIRAAALAVEKHMDAVHGRGGLADDIAVDHPRLLPALEHLEASLARLLVEVWEARAAAADTDMNMNRSFSARLDRLAHQLRHAADEEVDLLHESLNEPMGLD